MWSGGAGAEGARAEGEAFCKTDFEDVQFVFSRVHHHIHKRGEQGLLVPLSACKSKAKKGACNHDFPKVKHINARVKVVCRGVAAAHGLRVSGRRDAFGSLLGKRSCVWFSGTAPGLAALCRSNTNTMPNFRVPITSRTHDASCARACLRAADSVKKLCVIAQRAQKQTPGYYCGYSAKL